MARCSERNARLRASGIVTLASPGNASSTWTYSFNPPQSGGVYYTAALVIDTNYRYAVSPFVSFSLADSVAPTATITTPANNSTTSGAVNVTGTATDNSGVASVGVAIYRYADGFYWNGSAWQSGFVTVPATVATPGGTSTGFSRSFTPSGPGYYLVAVLPIDTNGNYSFVGWNIINAT
jgi:Bacterial Ig domain